MPARGSTGSGTAVAGQGKLTLSDSEVQAYSKNRFADRSLRHAIGQLVSERQACHERHMRQIVEWRHFMHHSARTSGFWCDSVDSGGERDGPEERGGRGVVRGPSRGAGRESSLEHRHPEGSSSSSSPLQSPRREADPLTLTRGGARTWAYSYSASSHNLLYNQAAELARGQGSRLFLRRSSSIPSPDTPHNHHHNHHDYDLWSRSRSVISDVTLDPQTPTPSPGRPMTGRSTPGLRFKSASRDKLASPSRRPPTGRSTPGLRLKSVSQEKLTASASVARGRPRTSVGPACGDTKARRTAWASKTSEAVDHGDSTDGGDGSAQKPKPKQLSSVSFDYGNLQSDEKIDINSTEIKDDHIIMSTIKFPADSRKLSVVEITNGDLVAPDDVKLGESKAESDTKVSTETEVIILEQTCLSLSVAEKNRAQTQDVSDNDNSEVKSVNGVGNNSAEEQKPDASNSELTVPQAADIQRKDSVLSDSDNVFLATKDTENVDPNNVEKQGEQAGEKHIHTQSPTAVAEQSESRSAEIDKEPIPEPDLSAEAIKAKDSSGGVTSLTVDVIKPDLGAPRHTVSAAGSAVTSAGAHRRRSQGDGRGGNPRPQSVGDALILGPAGSAVDGASTPSGYRRHRSSSMTSDSFPRGRAAGRFFPLQSRPAADGGRRSSFLKIVDSLEALRERTNRRMSRGAGSESGLDQPHNEATGLQQNEANANPTLNGIEANGANGASNEVKDGSLSPQRSTDRADVGGRTLSTSERDLARSAASAQNTARNSEGASAENAGAPHDQALSEKKPLPSLTLVDKKKATELSDKATTMTQPDQVDAGEGSKNDPVIFNPGLKAPRLGAGCVVFKGHKLRNYVRPQERYRSPSFLGGFGARGKSSRSGLARAGGSNGVGGKVRFEPVLPKQARQRVLEELVERNNRPVKVQEGVVPPQLKEKIDIFFRSIEPYLPKPELALD